MTYRYLKALRFYGPDVLKVLELAVVRIRISKIIIGIFWECWPAQPWGSSTIPPAILGTFLWLKRHSGLLRPYEALYDALSWYTTWPLKGF